MITFDKEIRAAFPGKANKVLRAELRKVAHPGEGYRVRAMANRFALTATGKAGLEYLAQLCDHYPFSMPIIDLSNCADG
jgi:hypothetical protein